MREEVEVKGLRITPDGMLVQDVSPDSTTSINGEFLWDYAMRRRSIARDLAGLAGFRAIDSWTEVLKTYLLKPAPMGYRKIRGCRS